MLFANISGGTIMKSLKIKLVLIIAILCAVLLAGECFVIYKKSAASFEGQLNENYNVQTEFFAAELTGWLLQTTGTVSAAEAAIGSGENSIPAVERLLLPSLLQIPWLPWFMSA